MYIRLLITTVFIVVKKKKDTASMFLNITVVKHIMAIYIIEYYSAVKRMC